MITLNILIILKLVLISNSYVAKLSFVQNKGAECWGQVVNGCSKELNSTDINQVCCFIINDEKCILDKLKNNEE